MTDLNTRIPLSTKTRESLKARKRGGERYEEVVQRLLEETEPGL